MCLFCSVRVVSCSGALAVSISSSAPLADLSKVSCFVCSKPSRWFPYLDDALVPCPVLASQVSVCLQANVVLLSPCAAKPCPPQPRFNPHPQLLFCVSSSCQPLCPSPLPHTSALQCLNAPNQTRWSKAALTARVLHACLNLCCPCAYYCPFISLPFSPLFFSFLSLLSFILFLKRLSFFTLLKSCGSKCME